MFPIAQLHIFQSCKPPLTKSNLHNPLSHTHTLAIMYSIPYISFIWITLFFILFYSICSYIVVPLSMISRTSSIVNLKRITRTKQTNKKKKSNEINSIYLLNVYYFFCLYSIPFYILFFLSSFLHFVVVFYVINLRSCEEKPKNKTEI